MKKIKSFFKGIKKESKMVRWPDGKSLSKYAIISVLMVVFFGVYFYGLDALFAFLRGLVA